MGNILNSAILPIICGLQLLEGLQVVFREHPLLLCWTVEVLNC